MSESVPMNLANQPKPFSLNDLAAKVATVYTATMTATKALGISPKSDLDCLVCLKEANGTLQELIALIQSKQANLEEIAPENPTPNTSLISEEINQEKAQFHVVGVQLFEHGKIVGTSLYSTVVKARGVRDTLNKKFAELRVNHEAKMMNYPVY